MVLALEILAVAALLQVNVILAVELGKRWRRRREWLPPPTPSKRQYPPADLSRISY